MIKDLQLLSFEVCRECTLAKRHTWCPTNAPSRFPQAHDEGAGESDILRFAEACHTRGFRGLVCYHYYNEPMLALPFVLRLAAKLRARPGLGSGLWTNGTLIDAADLDWLAFFDRVWITEHKEHSAERLDMLLRLATANPDKIRLVHGEHDDRLTVYQPPTGTKAGPCWRPAHLELPIDFYGNVHLCCGDWAGAVKLGNITRDDAAGILDRFEAAGEVAAAGELEMCRRCHEVSRSPALDDEGYRA